MCFFDADGERWLLDQGVNLGLGDFGLSRPFLVFGLVAAENLGLHDFLMALAIVEAFVLSLGTGWISEFSIGRFI